MPLSIKKLNRLKVQSKKISSALNPTLFSNFENDFVSRSGLTLSDIQEKLDHISNCASIIQLNEKWERGPDDCLEQLFTVSNANYCKQPSICPVCADRLQNRRRARYHESIKAQAELVESGSRYGYFLTYTIDAGPDLSDRLEHLKESRIKFRVMGQRRKDGRSKGESGKIRAGLSTIEIKKGEGSKEWHAHCHELIFTDERLDYSIYDEEMKKILKDRYGTDIPKDELDKIVNKKIEFRGELVAVSKMSEEWLKSTGDSISLHVAPLVHVPRSASLKKKKMLKKMSFADSVAYQAREVLKYPFKSPQMFDENTGLDLIEVLTSTYNKRMVSSMGDFRGLPGSDYEEDQVELEPYIITWNGKENSYGNLQKGTLKEELDKDQAHSTRSEVAKLLGEYRRKRRELIIAGMPDLYQALDSLKENFRKRVFSIWSLFRTKMSFVTRSDDWDHDYSPTLLLQGRYCPGMTNRDIWTAAFS